MSKSMLKAAKLKVLADLPEGRPLPMSEIVAKYPDDPTWANTARATVMELAESGEVKFEARFNTVTKTGAAK